MYKGNTIGVVVPAYNEAGLVGDVIESLPAFVDRAYVVDDCSTDETWAEITAAAARVNESRDAPAIADGGALDERIVPIQHDANRGVGGAIKTGYLAAREEGLDVVAVMGGDGQMDPSILDRIVDPVVTDRADYAKGNRLLRPGDTTPMPTHRVFGNHVLTLLTRIASGYWTVGDPQNGYTAISREMIDAASVTEMYEFYGYCNDLLVKLNVADARVADVPMTAKYDEETSHIQLSSYVPRVSAMLARNFFWRMKAKYLDRGVRSIPGSYLIGTTIAAVGILLIVSALLGGDDGWFLAGGLAVFGAVLVTLIGAALDRLRNSHLDFVVTV